MTKPQAFSVMTVDQQVKSLRDCVQGILSSYEFGAFSFELINHEFNSTYKVLSESGVRYALRVNVNSDRSRENLDAEIYWVSQVNSVRTPKPVKNSRGDFVTTGWHEASGRELSAVVYTWLEGEEVGDEPTLEQIHAMGVAMAKLHSEAEHIQLPPGAELPSVDDFLWGQKDMLFSPVSSLSEADKKDLAVVRTEVEAALEVLSRDAKVQPIHADIHPYNVMWHEGELAVFDFDDSAIGLPVQDLATSLYYLDTDEQDQAFLAGYSSVRELPKFTEKQMKLLKLQRRIILLNYLFETSNPEHRAMADSYAVETLRRIRALD